MPLCAWVLYAAAHASGIDAVFVSTDDEEIADTVTSLNLDVQIIWRPPELATDTASTESVMLHFAEIQPFDRLVTIQATSPLLEASDLDEALNKFKLDKFNSMLSAVRKKIFVWTDGAAPLNYDPRNRPRRQDMNGLLVENGAFYITERSTLLREQCRLGGRIGVYEMALDADIELDEPHDWVIVEERLAKRRKTQ